MNRSPATLQSLAASIVIFASGLPARGQTFTASVVARDLSKPGQAVPLLEPGTPPLVAVAEAGADRIAVFEPGAGYGRVASVACPGGPTLLVAADLNGDRRTDVVALCEGKNEVRVFLNGGRGRLRETAVHALPEEPASMALARPSPKEPPVLCVLLAREARSIERFAIRDGKIRRIDALALPADAVTVAAGDVNADGADDLVVLHAEEANFSLWIADAKGRPVLAATTPASQDTEVKPRPVAAEITDLDGDGAAEILISSEVSCQLTVFRGAKGARNVTFAAGHPITLSGWLLASGDVTGDARRDIVAGNLFSVESSIDLFSGDGAGTLARVTNHVEKGDVRGLLVMDLDGDGRAEVLVAMDDRLVRLVLAP